MFKLLLLALSLLSCIAFAQMPRTSPSSVKLQAPRGSWGLFTVDAESAWSENAAEVIVAVIDTGADVTHPDLRSALWTNPGESGIVESPKCHDQRFSQSAFCDKARNGVDDDGNGFVDDVHGWNFASENNDLKDNAGHGTHIAGIIGATGDFALRGVAPNARLMILKYTDPKTSGDPLMNTIHAIEYATRMGAKIINYSAGGKRPSRLERDAIAAAGARGVLFIAAAGNEGSNSDQSGYFPADYDLPNIVSVTAVDPSIQVLKTSNYGSRSVSVAAPGERILSTVPGGHYGLMTGTSQATAFASGIAALLLGNRRGVMSPLAIADAIAMSGVTQESLRSKTRSETLVNARRALVMHDSATSATGTVVEEMRLEAKMLEAAL
jgi:thermitase